jgi:hypothetical protein
VLIVLQQSGLLPIGHAARVRHCCTVTALAVSAESKTLSILWQRTHLPYDALRLLPLTHVAYTGAVCVMCMNSVIVVNQEERRNEWLCRSSVSGSQHRHMGAPTGARAKGRHIFHRCLLYRRA